MNSLPHNLSFLLIDDTPLWFPSLGKKLATPEENYTTSIFTTGMQPKKTWEVQAEKIKVNVELLPSCFYRKTQTLLSDFASEDDINRSLDSLHQALLIIERTPSLADSISYLLKSIHILKSQEYGYDKSFSLPSIPYSIFLNISQGNYSKIRIAEAIVHESMHLQLTLLENKYPLFTEYQEMHYSPWKRSDRPVSGVIHALYVFKVIKEWLNDVSSKDEEWIPYTEQRIQEIKEEISTLNPNKYTNSLTKNGLFLLQRILS